MPASAHSAQPPGAQGPSRSDARRNRQKLLDAAALAFNDEGTGASLDDIARAAGVANATLYRHFPTRQALITAVYDDRFRGLCAAAEELRSARPPLEASGVGSGYRGEFCRVDNDVDECEADRIGQRHQLVRRGGIVGRHHELREIFP